MAYYVKDKPYTDHPLMDEICYNCKLILKSIVIKNDVLALSKETETSLADAETYFLQKEIGNIDFNTFNFTKEIYMAYGYSENQAKGFLNDRYSVPEADRDDLTEFANEYFRENFEEQNNYYRMLMGLPPYNSGEEYYIYLTSSDIPSGYSEQVDLSLPLHEQAIDLINLLYENGKISELREIYPGSNYSYMNYLGSKTIDLYTARKANKWDILYMPSVYYLVEDRFTDLYKINRDQYMTRSYQEYFSQSGEYYDQMMILIVLAETFANMITDTPEWYIRRDVFDLRSCKYFLESSGVEYFKVIPLKYQIRIVKNLNKLIKYKSSNRNNADILELFKSINTKIYKYWLYKKKDSDSETGYSLEFISSNYNESYDNYIKDYKYRYPYDDLTLQDKFWDGEDDHDYIKNQIMNQEFTIQGTKYMSIEYQVSMKDWLYQTEYMLGLILDSNLYEGMDDYRIAVPSIDDNAKFKLADLFLFLVVLTNSYYRDNLDSDETRIRVPNNITDGPEPTVNEEYYDWKKKYLSEMFVKKNGRIHGFNTTLDKDELIEVLERRHSHLRFGSPKEDGLDALTNDEYKEEADEWLNELGIYDFIVPDSSITSIDDLVGIYEINTKIYDKIREEIINAHNEDDKKYFEYIFQELFTRPFDTAFYTKTSSGHVTEFTDLIYVLQDRSYILYDVYIGLMKESNIETKQDFMRSVMNDVVDTLEYYLSGDGLEYLYSFVSINSFGAMVKYIYLMLGFFKSYKVYFLDPYYTLQADDELENSVRPIDVINEYKLISYKWDASHVEDYVGSITNKRSFNDTAESDMYEVSDIYAHYDPDPLFDFDIDGVTAEKGEQETTDIDCGEADPATAPHYMMLNGGFSFLGEIHIRDINGGEAKEERDTYYHIDGGDSISNYLQSLKTGFENFQNMIDGGAAGRDEFFSNTMHLKLVGTELQGDAIISPSSDNLIIVKDDGLYVDAGDFGSSTEYYILMQDMNNILGTISHGTSSALEDLQVIIDEDARYERIRDIIADVLYSMIYVNGQMDRDKFRTTLYNWINSLVEVFTSSYSEEALNPYIWEDLK